MVINKEDGTSWNWKPTDQPDIAIFLPCYMVSDQIRKKQERPWGSQGNTQYFSRGSKQALRKLTLCFIFL